MPESRPRLGRRQAALYAAEAEALAGAGIRWVRLREAQAYLDGLISSQWFGDRWPHFGWCRVRRRGSGARWSLCHPVSEGGVAGGEIYLAELTQPALLHELAHLLAGPAQGHSSAFATVQLTLVGREMGFFAAAEYRAALGRRPEFAGIS